MEPVPVPTQKAAYQQIQQSLVRSRSRSGDSVSAMSGISSTSGGSTLGPLPEERAGSLGGGKKKQIKVGSPVTSPGSIVKALKSNADGSNSKTRRYSAPPIPDICQVTKSYTFKSNYIRHHINIYFLFFSCPLLRFNLQSDNLHQVTDVEQAQAVRAARLLLHYTGKCHQPVLHTIWSLRQ